MSRNRIQAGIGQSSNGRLTRSSKSRAAVRMALGLAMGVVVAELSPAAMGQATCCDGHSKNHFRLQNVSLAY